jgi:hypothetical protein
LGWHATANTGTYHIQLSISSLFSPLIFEDSAIGTTTMSVGLLSPGTTYYWRVRGKNAGGVSPWSEQWSFTTVPNPPQIPVLTSPLDGAVRVEPTSVITWSCQSSTVTNHVQISLNSSFSEIVKQDSTLTATTLTIGLLSASTTYYWRVRGKNTGGVSPWSGCWSFTMAAATDMHDTNNKKQKNNSFNFAVYPSVVGKEFFEVGFYFQSLQRNNGTISIYDALGNKIFERRYVLNPCEKLISFDHWNLTNHSGKKVNSGTYLVVLKTAESSGKNRVLMRYIGIKKSF